MYSPVHATHPFSENASRYVPSGHAWHSNLSINTCNVVPAGQEHVFVSLAWMSGDPHAHMSAVVAPGNSVVEYCGHCVHSVCRLVPALYESVGHSSQFVLPVASI